MREFTKALGFTALGAAMLGAVQVGDGHTIAQRLEFKPAGRLLVVPKSIIRGKGPTRRLEAIRTPARRIAGYPSQVTFECEAQDFESRVTRRIGERRLAELLSGRQ